jgi:nicotinamidase-related amidase
MTRTLLVIDVQNEYFPGGALPLWQPEEAEARIVTAIGQARAAGDKVVLVQHVGKPDARLFAEGGVGVAIRPAILAAAGDAPIVTKQFADAFQDTDLASHLADTDVLLISGMMTQNCVVFTALSRAADDLRLQVVGDLCTAPAEVVHMIALNALSSKGLVVSAKETWASRD